MNFRYNVIVFMIWFGICVQNTKQNSTEIDENIINNNISSNWSEINDNSTVYTLDPKESESNDTEEEEANVDSEDEEEMSFKEPQNPSEFMDYFEELMQRTRVRLEELFEQYMPQLIQMSSSVTLSPDCTFDAIRILFGLRKLKPWAIKILDSSGKVPDGILGGTLTALGSYDDCLESRIGEEQSEDSTRGQYCAINVRPYLPPKPPLDSVEKLFNDAADAKGFAKEHHFARIAPLFYYLKLRLGICLPASCTLNDLDLITQRISHRFRVNVTVQSCDVKQSFNIETNQIIPLCIITTLLALILLATAFDTVRRNRSHEIKRLSTVLTKCWLSFSLYTNSANILTTKVSENTIKPLNGLKVLSLIWIMIAHTYMTLDFRATGRLVTTRELPKGLFFQFVLNASLAIETFFFLSGVLVTYTTLKKMNSMPEWKPRNWIAFYLHRYIRLTPAIMLLIVIFLFSYRLGNGPLWQELIYPTVDKCRDNWWTHALYVSNFIKGKNMCFLHLWYIAADMQLFIFTPIFIILLHRNAYFGQLLLIITIGASIISTGIITYLQELPPTLLFNNPDPSARRLYGNLIFVKPYPHAGPYMVGMLTGYLLHKYSHIKLPKRFVFIGWFVSISTLILEIFSTWTWNKGDVHPSSLITVLYAGSFRVLWALSMSWITIACHNGFGGNINAFLSNSMFTPLSRLSYVAYLIHPGMMYIFIASTRNIFAFSHYFVIQLFFSHLTTTFIVSYFFSLIIETPFLSLEQVLHKYIITANYSRKIKLYSVTSVDSTASDREDLHKSQETIDAIEKYNKLKPFSRLPDLDYKFIKKVDRKDEPNNKLVFNYKL